jgi:phage gp46-like protein
MAQNLQLDPLKRDYVLGQNGSPIASDRVEEAVYFALTIPQNAWLYGTPNQGSNLNQLENVKRTLSIEQQISAYASDAIERQVIATGQATAAQVRNLEATRTGSLNKIEVIPAQVQVSDQLNFVSV